MATREESSGEIRQLARYEVRAEADRTHSASAEVKKFASVLYPECQAPVEFVDYRLVDAKGTR